MADESNDITDIDDWGTLLLATKQIPSIRMHEGEILWQCIQLIMKTSFAIAFIGGAYWVGGLFNNGFITLVGGVSYELYLVHFRLLELPPKRCLGHVCFLRSKLSRCMGC